VAIPWKTIVTRGVRKDGAVQVCVITSTHSLRRVMVVSMTMAELTVLGAMTMVTSVDLARLLDQILSLAAGVQME